MAPQPKFKHLMNSTTIKKVLKSKITRSIAISVKGHFNTMWAISTAHFVSTSYVKTVHMMVLFVKRDIILK